MHNHTHKQYTKSLRTYKAIIRLYPKSHRLEYGDQMVQTLEDILDGQHTRFDRFTTLVRVGAELPANIVEEHIHNMEGKTVKDIVSQIGKRNLIVLSVGVVIVAVGAVIVLSANSTYQPTTRTNLLNSSEEVSCLQNQENKNLSVPENDGTYIGNTVALSITDIPAGTNVDVHLKTYTSSSATGTAVYPQGYGSYNFTATKTKGDYVDNYTGGWTVTKFTVCKP